MNEIVTILFYDNLMIKKQSYDTQLLNKNAKNLIEIDLCHNSDDTKLLRENKE